MPKAEDGRSDAGFELEVDGRNPSCGGYLGDLGGFPLPRLPRLISSSGYGAMEIGRIPAGAPFLTLGF